jgi:hypothetical protein
MSPCKTLLVLQDSGGADIDFTARLNAAENERRQVKVKVPMEWYKKTAVEREFI